MTIGVLAFQGDVIEHVSACREFNVDVREVRSVDELSTVDALIIPGGESTVISKFLIETGVGEAIRHRSKTESFPLYGTCAGAIILSATVHSHGLVDDRVQSLGLIDIATERNAYGPQTESFETPISIDGRTCSAVFIRAPKITHVGSGVEVLARYDGDPVLCRQGNVLVSTFHPELSDERSPVYRIFIDMVQNAR